MFCSLRCAMFAVFSFLSFLWAMPASAGDITLGSDLFVGPLEVTQGIQNFGNDVRLVESKRTFVRFHVAATGVPSPANEIDDVEAVLLVQRIAPGPTTFLGVLQPINPQGTIDVEEAPSRAGHDDSFLFEISAGWRAGTLRITALLDPQDDISESNENNNIAEVEVEFLDVPPVRVRLYNVSYPGGDLPSDDDHTLFRAWMRAAYPATALLVEEQTLWTGINWTQDTCNCPKDIDGDCTAADFCANDSLWPCDSDGDCGCGRLNNQLANTRALEQVLSPDSFDADRRFVGWVDESPGFMRGCSPGSDLKVASGPTGTKNWGWDNDGSYADWYTGHELGHAYGRSHAPCCDAAGMAFFPYPMCRLSDGAESSFWGYDSSVDQILNPNTFTDVMSYCDFQWPSDFTFEAILDQLILEGGAPPGPPPSGPGDFVLLTGTGNVSRGTLAIRSAMLLRGVLNPFPPPPSAGTHIVQLRDASGGVLASHAIEMIAYENDLDLYPPDVDETGGTDTPGAFMSYFAFVPGTFSIHIVQGMTEVASLQLSNNAPMVEITSPNGGEAIGPQTMVTWTMSDPDGDALSSDVFYSGDGGMTWKMVAAGVPGTSVPVDLQGLPGTGTALFRVLTSDGFYTDYDDSDAPFAVTGQPPSIEIIAPSDDSAYPIPNSISFEAQADDPEDGPLGGAAIVWSSSLIGVFGTGEARISALPPGTHVITATATDSDGNTATASIQVSVAMVRAAPALSPLALVAGIGVLTAIARRRIRRRSRSVDRCVLATSGAAGAAGCGSGTERP